MLVPPPAPPSPGLSPPEGDIASEPVPPLLGRPTFDAGLGRNHCTSIGAAASTHVGGARFAPASSGAPRPAPLRPEPPPFVPDPPPTDRWRRNDIVGQQRAARSAAPPPVLPVPPPLPASVGGGGTTFGTPTLGAEDAAPERVPVPPDTPRKAVEQPRSIRESYPCRFERRADCRRSRTGAHARWRWNDIRGKRSSSSRQSGRSNEPLEVVARLQ